MMTSSLIGEFKRRIDEWDRRGVVKRRPDVDGQRYTS